MSFTEVPARNGFPRGIYARRVARGDQKEVGRTCEITARLEQDGELRSDL